MSVKTVQSNQTGRFVGHAATVALAYQEQERVSFDPQPVTNPMGHVKSNHLQGISVAVVDLEGPAGTTLPLRRTLQSMGCVVHPTTNVAGLGKVLGHHACDAVVLQARSRLAWARLVMQRIRALHGPVRFVVLVQAAEAAWAQVALAGTGAQVIKDDDLSGEALVPVFHNQPQEDASQRENLMGQDAREAWSSLSRILQARPYQDSLRKIVLRAVTPQRQSEPLTADQVADVQNLFELLGFLA